jgi:maltose O-acetyltransferase
VCIVDRVGGQARRLASAVLRAAIERDYNPAVTRHLNMATAEERVRRLRARGMRVGRNVIIYGEVIFQGPAELVQIGDNCSLTDRCVVLTQVPLTALATGRAWAAPVRILENSLVMHGSCILPGVTIGPNAIVGAQSTVMEDVPPNSVAAGNPARVICSLQNWVARQSKDLQEHPDRYTERHGVTGSDRHIGIWDPVLGPGQRTPAAQERDAR